MWHKIRMMLAAVLAAACLSIAGVGPIQASAGWTHYHYDNAGPAFAPGGFCGLDQNIEITPAGATDEWDGPRIGNTVSYRLLERTTYNWKNLANGKSVLVRYDYVANELDTINPSWTNNVYSQPWYSNLPQSVSVWMTGTIESMAASDGAAIGDVGTMWLTERFNSNGDLVAAPRVMIFGSMPIHRGPYSMEEGAWTVGCTFLQKHLS